MQESLARSRLARIGLALAALALAGVGAGAVAFYLAFLRDLPDLRTLEDYQPLLASHVYDRKGRLVGEFFDERRTLVPLEEVPRHVVMAFVAAEDHGFFEHGGLDFQAIVRAALANLRAGGEIRQGGSTITQQVAKALLLSPERRYTRKVKDMLLARRIEQRFSKDEILYLYLNQIYFGNGAYGVAEAARSYFGVRPAELSVSQAALLAGLPKAPTTYSPHLNPDAAEHRRQYVLERMREEKIIDEEQYAEALANPPLLSGPVEREDLEVAAYFAEEVRRQLYDELGGELVRRAGLRIETTLDLDLQRSALASLRAGLEALDRRQGYRGPLRRVPPEAIEGALADIARENGLASGPAGAAPELPARALLGVVTQVDDKAGRARVAFAPDLHGVVLAEGLAWAKRPDAAGAGPVSRALRVGDVQRFVRRAPEGDPAAPEAEPRCDLVPEPAVQGALLAFEVGTGDVLAMVGGYDFAKSEFNRALQARRQPGSAFKPFIYGAALGRGFTAGSTVVDRPIVVEDPSSGLVWRPDNYKGEFLGRLTVREALSRSINNATIHLLSSVGIKEVVGFARRLGIESPLDPNLTLALGTSGVSLLELTRAYAVFPAQGKRVVPRFIARVVDRNGSALRENLPLSPAPIAETPAEEAQDAVPVPDRLPPEPEAAPQTAPARRELASEPVPAGYALSPVHAYLVTDLLRGVVVDPGGTGGKAGELGRPVAGKTGTTNEQADAWFVGFSPDVVAGVWVGFDEKKLLGRGETGAAAALPIWMDFMRAALADRPARDFDVPDGVVFARVDRATGLLAGPSGGDGYFQAFATGSEPTETAEGAMTASENDRLLRLDAF